MKVDVEVLRNFEERLNPAKPENIKIIGYGEISTVFELPELPGIALKRIPNFKSVEQVKRYIDLYFEYIDLLEGAGLRVPDSDATFVERRDGKTVLYIAQKMVGNVGNKVIQTAKADEAEEVFGRVLAEMKKVWDFNAEKREEGLEIGIDGQISNWAIMEEIYYFDTSTPMIRKNGIHQLDTEVFLQACPPGIRILLKKIFLQDILDRYFDFRKVVVDMIANLYKEGREDLIPIAINLANEFFKLNGYDFEAITAKEVEKYYKEDAFIWSLYLNLRKVHRFILTKALFGRYEYILPGKIRR
ncbi:DUF6206 family protein [Archaeoglobus fulgidus]|uniref:DUF6206 family protein n=1 Tax=Archaeoglobus fulgidus TaxID=2234 RepID=UPI000B34EE01|nr:DUF6206 family protein [Archaeoglobus fulgidus]